MTLRSERLESVSSRRRFPRLFLAAKHEEAAPLSEVILVWPDRSQSQVQDLSETGLLVSPQGVLGQLKIGQNLDVKVRLFGGELKPLSVKVLRMTAKSLLLSLESLTVQGRLKLEQEEREKLIRGNWRRMNPMTLHPQFHEAQWWHSTFDTNIWLWTDSAQALQKLAVEFESTALVYDGQGVKFLKTPSSFDETRGYAGPLTEPLSNKVEPGVDWSARLLKVLETDELPLGLSSLIRPYLPGTFGSASHV